MVSRKGRLKAVNRRSVSNVKMIPLWDTARKQWSSVSYTIFLKQCWHWDSLVACQLLTWIWLSTSSRPWVILYIRDRRLTALRASRLCHPRPHVIFFDTGFSFVVAFYETCGPTLHFLLGCHISSFVVIPHRAPSEVLRLFYTRSL